MAEKQRRKPGETREKLMNAALALVGKGRHFASLGIREVPRQAGVVPTSFYRHSRNMDDLGLQGLAGESRAVQEGIRSEMRYFASELANDLRRLKVADHLSDADLDMTCDLVVRSVAFSLTDILGISPDDDYQEEQVRQRTARFLQLIFVGAANWKSQS